MAIRFACRVRPLLAVVALGAALVVAPTLAEAAPHAQPSVTSVQKQLGELALKNSQLVEKYDHAEVVVGQREKTARAASRASAKAAASYTQAHAAFAQMIQAQYESGSFGAAAALLDSNSDSNYIDRIDTMNMISAHTAQVVKQVSQARDAAAASSTKASSLLADAKALRDGLAKQRRTVNAQIRRYQDLLATLNSAQQYAYQRAQNPSVSVTSAATTHLTAAASGAARKAVSFALAQVGKPYVWGAAGPSSYDCSGLTMAAWQTAGVSLPHSAADQYNYGQHVSQDQLQPGDLIFFYQPIGHVTIYIGNGMMVSAPTEGQNVSVVPLSAFTSDYVGATRLT
ncbi:MAG: peptidoglycan DL-endopeptidase CwlO [Pseudonocardiales bacterium]|nr:peptidoglycan DL-endopeptidase CwlO [Pseudonocardiales bacterium]